MAKGSPPLSEYNPMRVLFLIPKAKPPTLEGGNWSAAFRDFVTLCLTKDANDRPTAQAMLGHRFVKYARKTDLLIELTARHQEWRNRRPAPRKASAPDDTINATMVSEWSFGTVRAGDEVEEDAAALIAKASPRLPAGAPLDADLAALSIHEPPPKPVPLASPSLRSASPTLVNAPSSPRKTASPAPLPSPRKSKRDSYIRPDESVVEAAATVRPVRRTDGDTKRAGVEVSNRASFAPVADERETMGRSLIGDIISPVLAEVCLGAQVSLAVKL